MGRAEVDRMTLRASVAHGLEVDRPEAERLSVDDRAAERAAELAADALHAHRVRQARRQAAATPGRCSNCGQACLALSVYCDPDCRADHEAREQIVARTRHRTG